MAKNFRDNEEKKFIFEIEKEFLFSWEEVIDSLIRKN
jgi:hypothetical protein